jgi:hypothetical protein
MMKIISYLFLLFFIIVVVKTLNHNRILRSSPQRLLQSSSTSSPSFSNSIAKLTAINGVTGESLGDYGGVAISNNRIIVGAYGYANERGAAYLFGDPSNPQSGRSYSQLAVLTASDGEIGEWFGVSVAIDGDNIVVGAPTDASDGPGAVYIYRIINDNNNNNIASISEVAKLMASNGSAKDVFGTSVAMHGNSILVGAYGVDQNNSSNVGSAYLFGNLANDFNSPEWTQLQQIQPNYWTEYYNFGNSVAMDDNIAIIGTRDPNANAAHVFVPVTNDETGNSSSLLLSTSWTQMANSQDQQIAGLDLL